MQNCAPSLRSGIEHAPAPEPLNPLLFRKVVADVIGKHAEEDEPADPIYRHDPNVSPFLRIVLRGSFV